MESVVGMVSCSAVHRLVNTRGKKPVRFCFRRAKTSTRTRSRSQCHRLHEMGRKFYK